MLGFNITPVVKNLLIINIAIFVVQQFDIIPIRDLFSYHYIHSESFKPFQVITYMFVHADFGHLLGNMFALFIFGPMLERTLGQKRFLLMYAVAGLGGGAMFAALDYYDKFQLEQLAELYLNSPSPETFGNFIREGVGGISGFRFEYQQAVKEFAGAFDQNPESSVLIGQGRQIVNDLTYFKLNIPMMGASGAVYGILLAFGYLFPNAKLMLLFPPIPIKAKYLVGAYALFEIYGELQRTPGDNVAHLAHLGGMLFAFLLLKKWGMKALY
ncbi:rhomboid family intramembrane serine protease [Algivirga pacifica]|uniref:Rhomboid family intramembrane serine protease n=1 Tax=Algivirga pacifica TaxID=1162670 RepID=A0ABP9D8Y0_9BACT